MIKTKRVKLYYALALAAIATLIIVKYAVSHVSYQKQKFDATVINLAGRQRMLSQKLVKEYCFKNYLNWENDTLFSADLKEWNKVHQGLQLGDKDLNLPLQTNDSLHHLFTKLNPIQKQLALLLEKPFSDANFYLLQALENQFLEQMDTIVFSIEHLANTKKENYLRSQIFISIAAIILLVFELLFIFNPMFTQLLKENKKLKAINHTIAHQARMPLSNIISLCETLQGDCSEDEKKEFILALEKEGHYLDKTLKETIKLSD